MAAESCADPSIAGGCPEIERRWRIAFDVDAAGDVVAGFGRALVVFEKCLVERDQHGLRRERRQINDFDIQLSVGPFS